jgi:hypothetical protein
VGTKTVEADVLLLPFDQEHAPASPTYEGSHEPIKQVRSTATAVAITITTIGAVILVLVVQYLRPITPSHAHMSGSLPVTIIEAAWFSLINSEFCLAHPGEVIPFPFEQFAKFFDSPQANDWLPRPQWYRKQSRSVIPPWQESPEDAPGGDWHHGSLPPGTPFPGTPSEAHTSESHNMSGAVRHLVDEGGCEALKLSNLNAELIETLAYKINIKKPVMKNVLLLTLESTRKEVFPLIKNGQ